MKKGRDRAPGNAALSRLPDRLPRQPLDPRALTSERKFLTMRRTLAKAHRP